MGKPLIGILTWRQGKRFGEPSYLRQLVQEGRKLGADVFLFSASDVDTRKLKIKGFIPVSDGAFKQQIYPFPDIVIDRCRKPVKGYNTVRKQRLLSYANSTYTNKWNATQLFKKDIRVSRWIPETVEYTPENLRLMLKKYPLLIIKPGNGTGGKSIIKITRTNSGYQILGSDKNLRRKNVECKSFSSLITWVNKWTVDEKIRNGNFMIQQCLDLELVPGRVADTRLLIQKNERGQWDVTGLGIRVGRKNSPISNLHGGGIAASCEDVLSRKFNSARKQEILQECHELANQVVNVIEERFGQMMEFGLDIGIDVHGKVWLIEVNPKPGRDIFKQMGQKELYQLAVRRPIQYALYLAHRKKRIKQI
jgi:hypothetical protein